MIEAIVFTSGIYCDSKYEYDMDCGYSLKTIIIPSHQLRVDFGRYNNQFNVTYTDYVPQGTAIMLPLDMVVKLKTLAEYRQQIKQIEQDLTTHYKDIIKQYPSIPQI